MLLFRALFFSGLVGISAIASGQTVLPVPSDPLELATGPAQVSATADERASVLNLVERARQNNSFYTPGGAPYDLKLSFTSSGNSPYVGSGELEETWSSGSRWRWTAHLGDFAIDRLSLNGRLYDDPVPAVLPLRIQMLRQAFFRPVNHPLSYALVRTAAATWNGSAVTCVLTSGGGDVSNAVGRRWQETEYCVDPKTGLLQTYSEAPGIYIAYDYAGAIQFHGRTVARRFSIVEGGVTVLQAQVDSLSDGPAASAAVFTPSERMQANASGPTIYGPVRFPAFVPGPAGAAGPIQPVIVHALIGPDGKVLESEALQNSNPALSQLALDTVRNATYPPEIHDGRLRQRDAFINVQFVSQP